jgi:hypothetical protein
MSEPWNFTEAQRRQFREAQAEAKRVRPPSKPWRVSLTGSGHQDFRSRTGAYEAVQVLLRSKLGRVVVEHFEDGRWQRYEVLDPETGEGVTR